MNPRQSRRVASPAGRGAGRRPGAAKTGVWSDRVPDSRQQHLEWLSLVEISGPFLTVPVLTRIWPDLDPVDPPVRDALRLAHATRDTDPATWMGCVRDQLLGWGEAVNMERVAELGLAVAEHETTLAPTYTLVEPGTDRIILIGVDLPAGQHPTARLADQAWAATPVDRAALLCRHHDVPLALVSDGRWWALVWAPRGGVTSVAVFDSITWTESADRTVVRAFRSLLHRHRFLGVPTEQRLPALLAKSLDNQEKITEALGAQVRRAVELLVDAIACHEARRREAGEPTLADVPATEVYRGAVSVMMRVVFLLFAEERGLLPADNPIYAGSYSACDLGGELEARVSATGSQEALEHSHGAWRRLLALFTAVYYGIDHRQLPMPAYDGTMFDPDRHPWLTTVGVNDRTVLHMLTAVQYVTLHGERRRLTFRNIDVEQIGYVYEGLLAYDGYRADQPIVVIGSKPGLEAKIALRDLERLAEADPEPESLAAVLATTLKIGSIKCLADALRPTIDEAARIEALRQLLAATGGDRQLAERLLPFVGLLRDDLRGLPTVIRPGGFYVDTSPLRRNTGTLYTPSFLAAEVSEGALEPLVYQPGPLQTADRSQWRPVPSATILALRIADIAVGSGAFLVAACRYLAKRLVEARSAEGHLAAADYLAAADRPHNPIDVEADPVIIDARREIIQNCLYGVDINPMAVEMAKLSLWLVSMDPTRPFTFLDDRIVTGDSLLGVTNVEQIQAMHPDPAKGRALHGKWLVDHTADIRNLINDIANDRRHLASLPANDLPAILAKQRTLTQIEAKTETVRLLADLTVGAALAGSPNGERGLRDASQVAAGRANDLFRDVPGSREAARRQADRWLATDLPEHAFPRHPLHWPLTFPEVFEPTEDHTAGFDAIIGNPPFLGGKKISGSTGSAYREYLVQVLGNGKRGNADLIAYFFLRAHDLLSPTGQTGIIATNTIAQGDTREVGLDQILAKGAEIRQALKSEPWPSTSVKIQYSVVWTSHTPTTKDVPRILDNKKTQGITSSLDEVSRISGPAHRLTAGAKIAYIGSYIRGDGFLLESPRAKSLIDTDQNNLAILFPYLIGDDIDTRPNMSASRWVINFHDWPEERARAYLDCYEQVRREVKPERIGKAQADASRYWWRFFRPRPGLYAAIKGLERVIVITRVSKTVVPVMVPTGQVFSDATVVFATDDPALLGLLSSAPHYWWAVTRGSELGVTTRYTPTDVFETFALPELTQELRVVGDRLDSYRRELMLGRRAGLTDVYNLVHLPQVIDSDIVELRRIHVAIDEAVVRAYGWTDLLDAGLGHGFQDTRQGLRYTVAPTVRQEILDRLLELNHERYAAERPAAAEVTAIERLAELNQDIGAQPKRRGGRRSAERTR